MGDIHLLGSNLHVLWLCLTYTVRFESIVLFIHILSTHNLLFLNIFLTPPPFVSNGQHSTYPPSPPRQQWSAFGLPPLPPSSAMVSICHTPSPPSGGWRNMWTAPNSHQYCWVESEFKIATKLTYSTKPLYLTHHITQNVLKIALL